jgi:protein-disulfide isomerase
LYDKLVKLMKTLYSSTFLSIIIAFFAFLGMQGEAITIVRDIEHSFSYIEKPLPKAPDSESVKLPITVEVFYSFGCFGCDDFGLNTVPALQKMYLEDQDVDLNFHITPAPDNDGEYYAVVGLKCASEYGKYWEMHQKIHATTEPLSSREIDLLGQELGLPIMEFRNCLRSGKYDEDIGKAMDYASQKGITKMPTILIDDYKLYGNQPIENIERVINQIRNS